MHLLLMPTHERSTSHRKHPNFLSHQHEQLMIGLFDFILVHYMDHIIIKMPCAFELELIKFNIHLKQVVHQDVTERLPLDDLHLKFVRTLVLTTRVILFIVRPDSNLLEYLHSKFECKITPHHFYRKKN